MLPQEGVAVLLRGHVRRTHVEHPEIFGCHPGELFLVVHDQAVVMHAIPPGNRVRGFRARAAITVVRIGRFVKK